MLAKSNKITRVPFSQSLHTFLPLKMAPTIRKYTDVYECDVTTHCCCKFLTQPVSLAKINSHEETTITCTTTFIMFSPHTIATATTLLTCQDSSIEGPKAPVIGDTWPRRGPRQSRDMKSKRVQGSALSQNNTHKRCIHHVCCVSNQLWNYKRKQNKQEF